MVIYKYQKELWAINQKKRKSSIVIYKYKRLPIIGSLLYFNHGSIQK